MKYKIVVDSSSNLTKDYLKESDDIGFDVAPLTIRINNKEYVDDGSCSEEELLKALSETKEKTSSSCPSPDNFLSKLEGAEKYIIITISSKLSGAFNSANVAKNMYDHPENVMVIDSKLVAGAMRILVDKAVQLIKEDKSFEEIENELIKQRDDNKLLFVLDKFDNLIRNGRVNKILGFLASKLSIKPLCYGDDGEIKIMAKIRTFAGVIKKMSVEIGNMVSSTKGRKCIISHTKNEEFALILKDLIEKTYEFDSVDIEENKCLCAYYSLEGGIIVSF